MPRPDHRYPALLLAAAIGSVAGAAAVFGGGLLWRWRQATPDPDAEGEDPGARGLPGTPPGAAALERGFEPADMKAATLARSTAVLFLVAIVSLGLMIGMLKAFSHQRSLVPGPSRQQQAVIVPPRPHLEADPRQDYTRAMHAMDQAVGSWRWIDVAHTRARVPVQRGMALSLGRSLDDRP
ncbi:hypothetical protein [Lichenicoccus sp.]|uniref:hypothetical protein n=1 Tax=Lichenicoccus sp. TaxID=2781899 RepID=UPI003D11A76A